MWKIPVIRHLILVSPLVMSNYLWPPWNAASQASLSITNSRSFLKRMSIELVIPSNHFVFCYPLLFLPSVFPSIRVFSSESHLHMTTRKAIALTNKTVSKVMFLLLNILSRFVIAFLLRSKHLLISWLQSPSAAILEPKGGKKNLSLFPLFPYLFAMKWWDWMLWS